VLKLGYKTRKLKLAIVARYGRPVREHGKLFSLEVFPGVAAELYKLKALNCGVEEASEGDNTDNKTGCLCHVGSLE
jgi:hypothetical protein